MGQVEKEALLTPPTQYQGVWHTILWALLLTSKQYIPSKQLSNGHSPRRLGAGSQRRGTHIILSSTPSQRVDPFDYSPGDSVASNPGQGMLSSQQFTDPPGSSVACCPACTTNKLQSLTTQNQKHVSIHDHIFYIITSITPCQPL